MDSFVEHSIKEGQTTVVKQKVNFDEDMALASLVSI